LLEVRPDIAFALSKTGQQQNPTTDDYEALIYMTHYLYGTRYLGICLKKGQGNETEIFVKLRGYADAAYAIHCDERGQGKSQYCECFELIEVGQGESEESTGTFYFKSTRAPTVDLCSAESEMGSTVEATKTAVMLHGILQELNQTTYEPVEIFNDNQNNILLSTQFSGQSKRVRYMMPRLHWMMEKVKEKVIHLKYLNTQVLQADFGTKAHTPTEHSRKVERIMGKQNETSI